MKNPIENMPMLRSILCKYWLLAILATTIVSGCSRFNRADLNRIIPVPTKQSDWEELDLDKSSSVEGAASLQQTELIQRERQKLTEKIQSNLPEFKLPAVEVVANPLRPISDTASANDPQPGLIRLKSEWPETSPALSDSASPIAEERGEHEAAQAAKSSGSSSSTPSTLSNQATSRRPLPSSNGSSDTGTSTDTDELPASDTPWPSETAGLGLKPIECSSDDNCESEPALPHGDQSQDMANQNASPQEIANFEKSNSEGGTTDAPIKDVIAATTDFGSTAAASADASVDADEPSAIPTRIAATPDGATTATTSAMKSDATGTSPADDATPVAGGDFRPVGTAVLETPPSETSGSSAAKAASSIPVLTETPSMEASTTSFAPNTSPNTSPVAPQWRSRLASTIESIEDQIIELDLDDYRRPALQRSLAMLMVLETQLDDEAMALQSPERRAYWDHQLSAILNVLNSASSSADGSGALFTAIEHLEDATTELKNLAALRITTAEFCSEVNGFGQYRVMDRIRAGRPTLVYCEIENFKSLPGTQSNQPGFLTRLKCRATILTSDGRTAQEVEYPVIEDIARNRRRDFYLHLPLVLDHLPGGDYQLVVTIEDLGSGKSATLTPPRNFEIE